MGVKLFSEGAEFWNPTAATRGASYSPARANFRVAGYLINPIGGGVGGALFRFEHRVPRTPDIEIDIPKPPFRVGSNNFGLALPD